MKNFLKNKQFIGTFSALLFIGAFFVSNSALASTKFDHYKKYFKDLGFSVVRPEYEPLEEYAQFLKELSSIIPVQLEKESILPESEELSSAEDLADPLEFYEQKQKIKSEDWQILFASDKVKDFSLTNTILICDVAYANSEFSCNAFSVASKSDLIRPQKIAEGPQDQAIHFGEGFTKGKQIIIIPEQNLYVPSFQQKTTEFLKSYAKSLEFKYSYDAEASKSSSFDFVKSWGIETFLYALSFFAFVLIFKNFLITLVNSPKDFLKKETYASLYKKAISLLKENQKILLYSVICGTALLPFVLVITKYTLGSALNSQQLNDIFKLASNPSLWRASFPYISKTSYVFYAYIVLWAFLVSLYALPFAVELLEISLVKIFACKKLSNVYKGLSLALLSLGLFLSIVTNLPSMLPLLITLLIFTLYLLHFHLKSGLTFTGKEKIVSFATLTLVLALGLGINFYNAKKPVPERTQALIGVDDSVVMLPYKKIHSQEAFFEPMLLENFEHPLFIDDLLVYHPNYAEIQNKKLNSKAAVSGDFLLMGMDPKDYKKAVLSLPNLRKVLVQEEFSAFIYPSRFKYDFGATYSLNLSLTCSPEIKEKSVELLVHYLEDSKLSTKEIDLLVFPGCLDTETIDFSLPIDMPYIPSDELLLEIKDLPQELKVESLEFFVNENAVVMQFLKFANKREILVSSLSASPKRVLQVFTYGLPKEKDFSRKLGEEFDLGTLATELKHQGFVKNPFILWSTDSAVLIRNENIK